MPSVPARLANTQVTKKLGPDQPSARKLAERFGDALLCVRYRRDVKAGRRFTTVELVVDERPIPNGQRTPAIVHLRIAYDEVALRQAIKQHGGVWDRDLRVWCVSREAARTLNLQSRVLRNLPDMDGRSGKM